MWNVRVCVFQSWLYQFSRSEVCRGLNGSSQWKECISDKDRRMCCGQTDAANKPSQRSRWWIILVSWQPATEALAFQLSLSDGVPAWGIKHISQSMSGEVKALINAITCKVIITQMNKDLSFGSVYLHQMQIPKRVGKSGFI